MKYKYIECLVCKESIPITGAGHVAHMRKHVREGSLEETKGESKLEFVLSEDYKPYEDTHPYATLGNDPAKHQPTGVFDITESLKELMGHKVDPADYFITSGEAVKKAEKMCSDSYSLAMKAKAFKEKLKKARGEARYLETQRENERILAKCKSPRNKK